MLVARLMDAQNGNNNLVQMLEAAETEKKRFSDKLKDLQYKLEESQSLLDEERGAKEVLNAEVGMVLCLQKTWLPPLNV